MSKGISGATCGVWKARGQGKLSERCGSCICANAGAANGRPATKSISFNNPHLVYVVLGRGTMVFLQESAKTSIWSHGKMGEYKALGVEHGGDPLCCATGGSPVKQ